MTSTNEVEIRTGCEFSQMKLSRKDEAIEKDMQNAEVRTDRCVRPRYPVSFILRLSFLN